MTDTTIRVLNRRAAPYDPRIISPYEGPSGSYPWYREMENTHPHKEAAHHEAMEWAKDYEARDRLGNMACVFGVVAHFVSPDGKTIQTRWRGVVNYFHSNT